VIYKVAANFSAVQQKDSLQKLYCFGASTGVGMVYSVKTLTGVYKVEDCHFTTLCKKVGVFVLRIQFRSPETAGLSSR